MVLGTHIAWKVSTGEYLKGAWTLQEKIYYELANVWLEPLTVTLPNYSWRHC